MLLWIIAVGVPLVGLAFFVQRKILAGRKPDPRTQAYDPKTGLGRGAPGFQTNIKRIQVPPEIIARIRAGEDVSAEEITRAQEKMQREQERQAAAAAASGSETESNSTSKRKKKGGKR